jgi:hypothetical protein
VDVADVTRARPRRAVLRNEVLLVLGVSLGASAVSSVLTLIDLLTRAVALSQPRRA